MDRLLWTSVEALRRAVLSLSIVATLCPTCIALAAEVRQPARIARTGILSAASPALLAQFGILTPFLQHLRELGYVEGQNLVVDYRLAEGKPERLPDLAAELGRLHVDVILASGPAAARAAKSATSTIPIVFTLVGDAVAERGQDPQGRAGPTSPSSSRRSSSS